MKLKNSMLYDFDKNSARFLRFFKEISNSEGKIEP